MGSPLLQREEPAMGAAAIISLAEVREKKQRAESRQELHERFDHWLDSLEVQMKEPHPTLEQITHAVWPPNSVAARPSVWPTIGR